MYIGIDLGTSSVKLLLLSHKGEVVKTITKEYPLYFPKPLWSEQNPEDWYQAVISGLKDLVKTYDKESIKGMGFSGQMHGMVILDKDDNVIRPAILWNDQRTENECDYLNKIVGQKKLSEYTANISLTGFTAPKVLWLKENEPENFAKINKLMLPKDYIAYKLSNQFATDVSDASGTLYFDVSHKCWSKEMLKILSIKEEQLPVIYESYDVIGSLNENIAKEVGLTNKIKIIIGGGDQAVAAVGTGIVENNSCNLSLGTSGVVFVSSDEFALDKNNSLHSFCHANGRYHLMGVMLSAASSLKWWIESVNKSSDFETFLKEAETVEINKSVYFLPYLMGERTPINDPLAKGTFIGMTLNHERKHLTRAVLEGVAFALRDSFEIIKSLGIKIERVRVNGGGSKSALWVQIIADVLNVSVEKINTNDGPALGAAILASVGCKAYDTVESACNDIIKVTEVKDPNKSNVEKYDLKYQKYRLLYPKLKELFKII